MKCVVVCYVLACTLFSVLLGTLDKGGGTLKILPLNIASKRFKLGLKCRV